MSIEPFTLAGEFNNRQDFGPDGFLYLVMTLDAGGWAVAKMHKEDVSTAIVASEAVYDEAIAVAVAERLTARVSH